MAKVECTCLQCGNAFYAAKWHVDHGQGKYCSKTCSNVALENKVPCTCQQCSNIFYVKPSRAKRGNVKYCSADCYTKAGNVDCICVICSKLFQIKKNRLKNGGGRFCSYECSVIGKLKPVYRNCNQCGKEYRTTESQITRGHQNYYCSYECSCLGRRTRVDIKCDHCGVIFSAYLSAKIKGRKYCSKDCEVSDRNVDIDCACAYCGTLLKRPPSQVSRNKNQYCSSRCTHLAKRGENHPGWRGGGKHYRGTNWHQQRKLAFERDGGICQVCRSKHSTGGKKNAVHHIKPFRLFASYLDANNLLNLITLCDHCHGKAEHGKIPVPQRLF